MKKLISITSFICCLLPFYSPVNADQYQLIRHETTTINNRATVNFYGVSSSGTETLLKTWTHPDSNIIQLVSYIEKDTIVDQNNGKIYFYFHEQSEKNQFNVDTVVEYDLVNDSIKQLEFMPNLRDYQVYPISDATSNNTSDISTNTSNISTNTSNISTNTSNISTNTSNISTNSSNIKNLGEGVAGSTALTAALTALPQTAKDSKLSCGIGSGAYSSRYAVGFGCASKVNERVDINAGGSYVFGGSKSYGEGTLDSGVIKAGLVFKLGEIKKSTQISMKDKKVMETKIESLEEKNKKIISKNQKLENKLSILMARLEKIEEIALSENTSKDLAIYKLK